MKADDMARPHVQEQIIKALQAAKSELSFNDLVEKVSPLPRNDVKAAVVPLLYLRQVTFTPTRKFRLA